MCAQAQTFGSIDPLKHLNLRAKTATKINEGHNKTLAGETFQKRLDDCGLSVDT
jgi:hypothetical protein